MEDQKSTEEENVEARDEDGRSKCERFRSWLGGASFCIYVNYVMGAWGDRMWHFAVALYLVSLADGSLILAAILGFTQGGCILLLGSIIGNWVDKNHRLKVVRISLCVQNLAVATCAVCVCLTLYYEEYIHKAKEVTYLKYLSEAVIITLAILGELASVAYKIAIEKDWIVVVASGNQTQLANLNAITRAIDLTCKMVAPTVSGLIMANTSLLVSAIVIAVWNLVSVVVEYTLLSRVYRLVPRLAYKEPKKDTKEDDVPLKDMSNTSKEAKQEERLGGNNSAGDQSTVNKASKDTEEQATLLDKSHKEGDGAAADNVKPETADTKSKEEKQEKSIVHMLFKPFITLSRGWKIYSSQSIMFAGLALSFLYMTVLGMDSVTTGFIYANNVSETWVGVAMAMAGLTGILGTVVYTFMRKRVGLERTGLMAFNLEILCIMLCVLSVWMPGSPFDPFFKIPAPGLYRSDTGSRKALNCTPPLSGGHNRTSFDISVLGNNGSIAEYSYNRRRRSLFHVDGAQYLSYPSALMDTPSLQQHHVFRRSVSDINESQVDFGERITIPGCEEDFGVQISVILLIVGIVTSRVGLWMADLVITQLMQENVAESERGIVNGVQNSLNCLMDLLKFTLVIIVPFIETFGYLIVLSFVFIVTAGCLFAYHSWRVRGHLLPHFDRICRAPCVPHFLAPFHEQHQVVSTIHEVGDETQRPKHHDLDDVV